MATPRTAYTSDYLYTLLILILADCEGFSIFPCPAHGAPGRRCTDHDRGS